MHCTRNINKISAGLLALLLLFSVSVPAFAEDGHLIGNFETEDSDAGTEENGETLEEKLIVLSDGSIYSPGEELFYREVENSRFGTTVPDGTITTDPVRIFLAPALMGTLYRNGVIIDGTDLSCISEPGKYILAVSANDSTQTVRITFTIVSSPTSSIKEYNLPTDFFVVSATLNGEKTSYSRSYVDMSSDGDYEILYRSPAANKDYRLCVTVDHTAPAATLSGISAGKANGPVTVSGVEEDAVIYLERNGKETEYTGTIEETGAYVLTVQDKAGNETSYEFAVISYDNSGMKYLIVMGAVLVLALAGYFIYYRKYMRVN